MRSKFSTAKSAAVYQLKYGLRSMYGSMDWITQPPYKPTGAAESRHPVGQPKPIKPKSVIRHAVTVSD